MKSLLNGDGSGETASADVTDYKFPQNFGRLDDNKSSTIASHQPSGQSRLFCSLFKLILIWNLISFSFLLTFYDCFYKSAWPFFNQNIYFKN